MTSHSPDCQQMMEHSAWIDVSIPIRTGMITWPDDPEVALERVLSVENGDGCNVSRLHLGSHTGTHMDAPLHYLRDGLSIDQMPPDVTVGPARVLPIRNPAAVTLEELEPFDVQAGERILFRTRNSERLSYDAPFSMDYVSVSHAAARHLAERKVRMVGVDYLSVGGFETEGPETHITLLEAGIWVIEGLNLARIQPGPVDLLCLPLRLSGGDGAPARAFVRPL